MCRPVLDNEELSGPFASGTHLEKKGSFSHCFRFFSPNVELHPTGTEDLDLPSSRPKKELKSARDISGLVDRGILHV